MKIFFAILFVLVAGFCGQATATGYATLTKAALASPVIARIIVHKQKQPPKALRSTQPGRVRLVVEADVLAVLKAPDLVPARITYLWEGPLDAKGKPPSFKKQQFTVYLMPDVTADTSYKLVNETGQQPWSDVDEQTLRQIVKEAANDPLTTQHVATGIRSAFIDNQDDAAPHYNFITDTPSGDSVVLTLVGNTVLAANSNGIGDAMPVQPHTLLWYRVTCSLSPTLPEYVLIDQASPDDATQLSVAFAKIHQVLGTCE